MTKRFRTPIAKAGELKLSWGKLPHEDEDIVYTNGDGVPAGDRHLLYLYFSTVRSEFMKIKQEPSLIQELAKRGYNLETIKFSIQKIRS